MYNNYHRNWNKIMNKFDWMNTSRLWTASREKYWGHILEFLLCPASPQAPHFGPIGLSQLLLKWLESLDCEGITEGVDDGCKMKKPPKWDMYIHSFNRLTVCVVPFYKITSKVTRWLIIQFLIKISVVYCSWLQQFPLCLRTHKILLHQKPVAEVDLTAWPFL